MYNSRQSFVCALLARRLRFVMCCLRSVDSRSRAGCLGHLWRYRQINISILKTTDEYAVNHCHLREVRRQCKVGSEGTHVATCAHAYVFRYPRPHELDTPKHRRWHWQAAGLITSAVRTTTTGNRYLQQILLSYQSHVGDFHKRIFAIMLNATPYAGKTMRKCVFFCAVYYTQNPSCPSLLSFQML